MNSIQAARKNLQSTFLVIPPLLVIFGYGGMVCASEKGSLRRINKSFDSIPRN